MAVELVAVGRVANGDADTVEFEGGGIFALDLLEREAGKRPVGGLDGLGGQAVAVKGSAGRAAARSGRWRLRAPGRGAR
jgi:hypothetical protein